jgi:choline transport protein
MWWSYIFNVILGLVVLIVMLYGIGDLEDAINSTAPYLNLFNNSGSTGMAFALSVLLFLLIFAGNITALATASREMWAFSRDKGFPFSKWISKINKKHNVPDNAVYLTSVACGVLCLINLGSTFAFNIIVSLSLLGLLSTYMMSIGCVLFKRIKGEPLPPARWSLGRWGLAINAFAFCYSGFIIVFACFPSGLPVDVNTANWAPAVWFGVILLAIVVYWLHGRRHFTPPVIFVEGVRSSNMAIQQT